jgi:hypothetical protein
MKKGQNVGDLMGLVKKRMTLIHFNSPFLTLTLTNHVHVIKFMGTCESSFDFTSGTIWQGQSQITNVRKNYNSGKG